MTQSPELTGGAGFTFEGTVVASYLVSLFIEGAPRGLPGRKVVRVAVQQAPHGEPLDDLVIDADAPDDSRARLSLQIKSSLTISAAPSNKDFREVVINSWKTLARDGFREGIHRVGAATGSISDATARKLERVCEIARASATAEAFKAHFAPGAGSGQELRNIIEVFETVLNQGTGKPPTNEDIYRLLKRFTIIRFDLLHEGARDEAGSVEFLRPHLQDAAKAEYLWDRFKTIAREAAGRAGGFTRNSLLEALHGEFRLAQLPSLRRDIEKLLTASDYAIQDIGEDIDGVVVERPALIADAEEATSHRFVQIIGLAGSGKSAILRAIALKRRDAGPVIVLKSDRIDARGWAEYATSIGLTSTKLEGLLLELATMGSPTLIIDGLDRVEVVHRGVITDLVRGILKNPALGSWRILASLRDSGIEPLRTWLPHTLLTDGSVSTIEIRSFEDDEAAVLAERVPQLRSLLFSSNERVREIVRRPFFASVLARTIKSGASQTATEPTSEIDLVEAWWHRGGYAAEGADITRRRNALLRFARRGAATLGRGMGFDGIDPDALQALIDDQIIAEVKPGHTVKFTHDIFFEWSFLHLLIDSGDEWLSQVQEAGEPPVLGRVVELLSQSALRSGGWENHLVRIEAATMRPQWMRAWLLGPFGSPGFADQAPTYSDAVFRDDGRRFAKLTVWFQAEKTRSNPTILAGQTLLNLGSSAETARLADLLAWPSDLQMWVRFCQWLLDQLARCPTKTVPDVISAFEIWQNMWTDYGNAISTRIINTALAWLQDIENHRHPDEGFPERGAWKALDREELSELEDRLRMIVLRAARVKPDLIRAYLQRISGRSHLRHQIIGKIFLFSPILSLRHAKDLVDVALAELLDELPQDRFERAKAENDLHYFDVRHYWDHLGIRTGIGEFSPASPLREPFASLFKSAPTEALRLTRTLCNHAMKAWRQLHDLDRNQHQVPIPLMLQFPWGSQTFWGDGRVYLWSRGVWGQKAVECALMAMENWAFDQAASGRAIDEVIHDIVVDNECCAILGIAVGLALAHNHATASTLPLATSQRLWHRDIARRVQDLGSIQANLIGFAMTGRDPEHAEAVRESNKRRSRGLDIRSLVMGFIVTGDDAFRSAIREALNSFPQDLPFEFESEKQNGAYTAKLQRTSEIWSKIGQIENYKAEPAPDGSGILIKHESPHAADEDVVEAGRRLQDMNAKGGLAIWAEKCFEQGNLAGGMLLAEAISRARGLDSAELFTTLDPDEQITHSCAGVVSGIAAVALRFGENLETRDIDWAKDVVKRAASTPEDFSNMWHPAAMVLFHPCTFAVRGLEALIRRGWDVDPAERLLLKLAAHPLEAVSACAIGAALSCWGQDPRFSWIAIDLGIRFCIINRSAVRSASGYDPADDMARRFQMISDAVEHLDAGTSPKQLPPLPPAWINAPLPDATGRGRRGRRAAEPVWRDPDELWRWDFAPRVLNEIPVDLVLKDNLRREPFLAFCDQLLTWTIERLVPPWETDDRARRRQHSADLFEWRANLSRFLGRVSAFLDEQEATRHFLDRILCLDDEVCFALLEPFVDQYIRVGVLDAPAILPEAIVLLMKCVERVLHDRGLANAVRRNGEVYGHDIPIIIRDLFFIRVTGASAATRFANDNWTEVRAVLPLINRLMTAAGAVPSISGPFLTLCERAIEHYPADSFTEQMLGALEGQEGIPSGWRGATFPARIASLVQELAERNQPLPLQLSQKMLRILDMLVDMGDRRAAALQTSELFKDVRAPDGRL